MALSTSPSTHTIWAVVRREALALLSVLEKRKWLFEWAVSGSLSYTLFMYSIEGTCTHAKVHMWKSEGNLELVLSSCHVSLWAGTRVVRLGGRGLHPLSHLEAQLRLLSTCHLPSWGWSLSFFICWSLFFVDVFRMFSDTSASFGVLIFSVY